LPEITLNFHIMIFEKTKYRLLILIFITAGLTAQNQHKDFSIKAFHVDIRCQVMTMNALRDLADKLSGIGVNTLIMEWEATFPYTQHATLSNQYAYSKNDIASFIDYCRTKGIDVIPLQNCFGHVEYILRHERYAAIREDRKEISQVCPMKEKQTKAIFTEIFTEMAALHPSPYFHIGGDETYLLGSCNLCSAKAEKEGKSKLFVDYVKIMCDIVKSLGKTPVLWADIILKYPEAADQLPEDAIFIDWNYGWKKDKFGDTEKLTELGIPFWGAPALRSAPDNLYLTQWKKHFDNIAAFIPDCRRNGYEGIVMTSWSTSGTYGFSYDADNEVIGMYPVRYVYPLSGFNILIEAYGEAINSTEPLDIHNFILNYGQKQFGFTAKESRSFYTLLNIPQNTIRHGKDTEGKSVKELKEEAERIKKETGALKPKRNRKEFDHFRLMFDLRLQYLTFKEIEHRFQSDDYNRKYAKVLLKETSQLKTFADKNDKRFIELNRGYLYKEEMREINRVRNEKLNNLLDILKRQVKQE
jgi:hypothetical protein